LVRGVARRRRATEPEVVFLNESGCQDAHTVYRWDVKTDRELPPVILNATVGTDGSGQRTVESTFSGAETDQVSSLNAAPTSLAEGRYESTILAADVRGPAASSAAAGRRVITSARPTLLEAQGRTCTLFGDTNGDQSVDSYDVDQLRLTYYANPSEPNDLWYLDPTAAGR
jgi:hypothetical protein